jgi:aryl-alcohol dehydrogenase-like predicted oxidoreductase
MADALADILQAGLARAIGVSNYNAVQTRRIHSALAKRQVVLASNQLSYSLLDRRIEFNGTLQVCQELDITVLSYSPLAQGSLTGKYSSQHSPKGLRSRVYTSQLFVKIQPLLELLSEIGQAYQGKSPAQVALNWTLCKGTLPIPGAKNARQALENAGALGWQLSPEDVQRLDRTSAGLNK